MSRTRDGGLAAGMLAIVGVLGTLQNWTILPAWLLGGAAGAVVAETLTYRRPSAVREQFERPVVIAGSALLAVAGVLVGAVLAPDRSLSLAAGALGTYILLLGLAHATGWTPSARA